jgi:hypothetical protein
MKRRLAMFDEFNWNGRAKQLTVYDNGIQIARFVDADFDQFISLGDTIQTAIDNKPEAVLPTELEAIEAQIAELTARKTELTKIKEDIVVSPEENLTET